MTVWHGTFAGTVFWYTRNDDGTWSARDKTGGGMWGRSDSNLKVGWAVVQDGSYQAAGAPGEGSNRGAVYVRQVSPTVYQAKGFVVEPDTVSGCTFGSAVALAWPFLAVGAVGCGPEGAAFLYEFSEQSGSWVKLGNRIDPASVALSIPVFGRTVAVSDQMVLVGGGGSVLLQYRAPTGSPTLVIHSCKIPLCWALPESGFNMQMDLHQQWLSTVYAYYREYY